MDMDQAAVWLGGSILTMLGIVVVVAGIIAVNNLIHKYWKPVTIFTRDSFTIFGMGGSAHDPLNLTDDEYNKLVAYLEELRNPPKVEPNLEKVNQ